MINLLHEYGYIGIFLFLVLGIVGLPLPDEMMMTFIGYLASVGQLKLFPTFISALVGSACGITFSYFLGVRLGYPFLRKYGNKFFITRRRLKMTQMMFRKYGNWLLFFGYFIPGVRHVTAYLAGISQISYPRFSVYAYTGAFFWCATFIGLGHMLGSNWEMVFNIMHKYGMRILLITLPILAIGISWYLWNQSQSDKPLDTK